jgi:ligand-binding SRPBCC domain-containing protein
LNDAFDLSRSIEVHLAGSDGYGEAVVALGGVTSGLIDMGQRVTWRANAMEPPAYFQDTMVQGAFRFMQHDHFFRALCSEETEMKDVFCFAAPLAVLGRIAEVMFLRRYMRTLPHERNVVLKRIAEPADCRKYLPVSS